MGNKYKLALISLMFLLFVPIQATPENPNYRCPQGTFAHEGMCVDYPQQQGFIEQIMGFFSTLEGLIVFLFIALAIIIMVVILI